ncbi:hypothetical protein [Frondihabitans peucedani]|uniref:Uncharacterized protein n=1 Tax=Frondihabitans peucedani TaxID=598626 RepID=A0ABP8E4H2_9MICO
MSAHIATLIWGPFAIVFGTCFVVFRQHISRQARAQRERRGIKIGPNTQSPAVMAIGGVILVCAGIFALVGGATGLLH